MALHPEFADLDIFLRSILAILHVPEVVLRDGVLLGGKKRRDGGKRTDLALAGVVVDLEEVVLGKLEGEGEENVERVENLRVKGL